MLERTTIFLGAFLLFLVQPMIGNTLLPVFGGTATVWSVCLATFQALLVGGYLYAHFVGRQTRRSASLPVHCGLLAVAAGIVFAATLHRARIVEFAATLPSALGVFVAVLLMVAAPYVVLSANSTLVQEISGGKYGLYAVSNLGSLCGLWAYPLVFERFLALTHQWTALAGLCVVYAVMFAGLVAGWRRASGRDSARPSRFCGRDERGSSVAGVEFYPLRYFALSALSCFLLNAVSTHLGADITPLPLLWVALLSVYLLSYILGFSNWASRVAPWIGILLVPLAIYAAWHMGLAEFRHFKMELATGAAVLFLGGLVIHSRLYAIRPDPGHLTMYYLMIALGGAFGGGVCSFLMPVVADRIVEYPVAVALALGVALAEAWRVTVRVAKDRLPEWLNGRNAAICGAVAVCAVGLVGAARVGSAEGVVLRRYRNFYGSGVVSRRTIEVSSGQPYEANEFRCNGTTHGFQILTGRWAGNTPTVYYSEHAGGLPFLNHPKEKGGKPIRAALCGMGVGTLAHYARPGDFFRFYEINPAVSEIAKDGRLFSFVPGCRGTVEIVVDDARRALERERSADEPKYDILVVDVFTGDAIPPHMATREAFSLYLDRLAPDGILAFHLSNWHLDLMPMIKAAMAEFGLEAEAYYCASTQYSFESTWAFLSRAELPQMFDARCHSKVDFALVPDVELMTDERHSLLPYIQWSIN